MFHPLCTVACVYIYFTNVHYPSSPQGVSAGPSAPEEYVEEMKKFVFQADSAAENDYGVIDKLRVSLSTNGLRCVVMSSVLGGVSSTSGPVDAIYTV